jgi:hypothetical protein
LYVGIAPDPLVKEPPWTNTMTGLAPSGDGVQIFRFR